ncbi:MAG: hypothetical protein QW063_02250 [Candidatus Nanoarchaeia archaeon]
MNKKILIVVLIIIVALLAFGTVTEIVKLIEQPPAKGKAQPAPKTNLTIFNFVFSETSVGPAVCDIRAESKIIFEGPIQKPTPCNGLTANYTIEGNIIKIYITTTPYEGFCVQVIADAFYKGSFDLLRPANVVPANIQIYYDGEKICDKTLTIS